jgi:hypothetical protein
VRPLGAGSILMVALVGLATLVGAATALGCLEPNGYAGPNAGGPSSYGPNDPTPFKITGTDEGAPYTVKVIDGGTTAATFSYTDSDSKQGTGGTFTMPDLGDSPRSVEVRFDVAHEGTTYPSTDFVNYEPPAPPADPNPATPGAMPAAGPADQGTKEGQRGAPHQAPELGTSAAQSPGSPAPAGSGQPTSLSEPQQTAESASETARAAESQSERAASGANQRAGREDEAGVGLPSLAELATDDTQVGPLAVPTIGLALLALLLVGGTLTLSVVFFLAGRAMPDPRRVAIEVGAALDPDTIEAELQGLISEQRAKRLLAREDDSLV